MARVLRRAAGSVVAASTAGLGVLHVADSPERRAAANDAYNARLTTDDDALPNAGTAKILCDVLSLDAPKAANEFNAGVIAATAGAAMITMLPTVHQADAWVRQSMGEQIGSRAAAFALAAAPTQTLAGCLQAVTQLAPHATARWLGPPSHARVLSLHESATPTASDALDGILDELYNTAAKSAADAGFDVAAVVGEGTDDDAAAAVHGSVSPTATRLRSWAAVLLAPAARWSDLVDAAGVGLRRARLIVPSPSAGAAAATADDGGAAASAVAAGADASTDSMRPASWQRVGARDGQIVLLPLTDMRVDVLLPLREAWAHGLPVARLVVPPGSALALDGTARWRIVDDHRADGGGAAMLFEYAPAVRGEGADALSDVAANRVLEGAAFALRAVLAMALPPPP